MISIGMTVTGAAGAAPTPAVGVRASRCDRLVATAPSAAPQQGSGLPAVRPWAPSLTGSAARFAGTAARELATDFVGRTARNGGYAGTTPRTTPGALPPRRPLA